MPYFPAVTDRTYTCQGCGGTFLVSSSRYSCLVIHPPGSCCHYGEQNHQTREFIGPDGKTPSQREAKP